jgi:hypothetical protein
LFVLFFLLFLLLIFLLFYSSVSLFFFFFLFVLLLLFFFLASSPLCSTSQDVDSYIFPEEIVDGGVALRPQQAKVMRTLLPKRLVPFFHADGLGAPKKALHAALNPLLDALSLFEQSTPSLISLYRKLSGEQASLPVDHSSQYADIHTQPRHALW